MLRQCWQWTVEAPPELKDKMISTLAQLHAALPAASLPVAPSSVGGGGGSAEEGGPSDAGGVNGDAAAEDDEADGLVPAFSVAKADVGAASDDELYY